MFNEDFSWELREKWDLFGLLGSPGASTANMHFGLIIPRTCLSVCLFWKLGNNKSADWETGT